MTHKTLCAAVALALPLVTMAAPPSDGKDTRAWLELQKSGKAASKEQRPVPGEIANKTYERYSKSFDHTIPEQFQRESINSGGGSGGDSK